MNTSRPKQRVSRTVKETEDWQHANVQYWCGRTNFYPLNRTDALVLHSACAGKLDESVYTYVTNPLNMDRPELKGYPAKMRNVDIISQNILRLLGELAQRYFNPMVIALNTNMKHKKEDLEYKLTVQQIKADFINGLIEAGVLPEEIAQTPLPQELINKEVSNLENELSKMGQHALNIILRDNNIDIIRRKTLYEFIVLGRFFTYSRVVEDELAYDWISPIEISFINTPNLMYVKDSEAVKRTVYMPMSEILDEFYDVEGFQEIVGEIEEQIGAIGFQSVTSGISSDVLRGMATGNFNNSVNQQIEGLMVEHVQWSSMCEIKKVSGVDEFGNSYEEIYDEDYVALPGEEVESKWVTEQWEGYRIANKWIVGVQAVPHTRATWSNPNKSEKEYNGRVFMNNYVIPESIGEKGIVYQIKYNIAHYHLEKVLNKNKDKITFFPIGIIPQKEGWDEFTAMYYADAHGYFFVDETNPQALAAMQYMKVLDMSLYQYIKELYDLLQRIKEDWDDAIGFNRQRKGAAMASDGKAVTEEALYRSSTATEELFREHEETMLVDLNRLVALSKAAWKKGKRGMYSSSKFKEVYYEIDPNVYNLLEFNVIAENSSKNQRDLEMMKGQLGNIAQQTEQLGMLPRIASAVNMAELTEELDAMEAKLMEGKQAQSQAENEAREVELRLRNRELDLKEFEIVTEDLRERELKLMEIEYSAFTQDLNNNNIPDVAEVGKLQLERDKLAAQMSLAREELTEKRAERMDKLKMAQEKNAVEIKKISAAKKTNNK
jgi:hypothetical protein